MKIDRLIGIITILLQQDKITAPELAERFEVSRRTINRDIEDLCKAGIPLMTTQGFQGGISILDNYKINNSLFSEDELQTMLAALRGFDSISMNSYLTSMVEKLSRKGNKITSDDVIQIDLASFYQSSLIPKIDLIKKAVLAHSLLCFDYYSSKGSSVRCIEPYRIIFRWSSWYVYGYCREKNAFRLFKLNRLWNLKELEEKFNVRDISASEENPDQFFSNEEFHLKALFEVSEKHRLIDEYGIDCFKIHQDMLLFERDFVSYDKMKEWVFSFGGAAVILEPQELKEDRKRQAEKIISMKI